MRKVIAASLVGSAFQLVLIAYFGHLSDRVGRRPVYLGGAIGAWLGYQVAGVLGGALAPIISVALLDRFDSGLAVSIDVLAALVVTIVAVLLARETAATDLRADSPEEAGGRSRSPARPVFH